MKVVQESGQKTNRTTFSDHPYVSSPLSIALQRLLSEIVRIKAKYSPVKDKSLKRVHADELMDFLKWGLEVVHENILPKFDRGNLKPSCPNSAMLTIYVGKIFANLHLFYTRETKLLKNIDALLTKTFEEEDTRLNQEEICTLLDENKKKLFKGTDKIPGESLEKFFSHVKNIIRGTQLYNYRGPSLLETITKGLNSSAFEMGTGYENAGYSFEHFHPMIFELAVSIAIIALEMPKELNKVISFINPKGLVAYSENLKGTTILSLLSFGGTFTFEEKDPGNTCVGPDDAVHSYQLTMLNQGMPIDAAFMYQGFFGFSFSAILGVLVAHSKKFPNDPEVKASMSRLLVEAQRHYDTHSKHPDLKSEKARAELLQEFVNQELLRSISDLEDNPDPVARLENLDGLSGLELVGALDTKILINEAKSRLARSIMNKKEGFFSDSFRSYIMQNDVLKSMMAQQLEDGCDLSYIDAPLPDDIFHVVQAKVVIVPIRSRLLSVLDAKLVELNCDPRGQQRLIAQRDQAVAIWISDEIKNRTAQVQQLLEETAAKKVTLEQLMAVRKKQVVDSCDSASLEVAIARSDADRLILCEIEEFAENLSLRKSAFKRLPANAPHSNDLITALVETSGLLTEPAEELRKLCQSATSHLKAEREEFERNLVEARQKAEEKAKAEAEYAKNMRELNIEVLEARLRECGAQKAALSGQKLPFMEERTLLISKLQELGCSDVEYRPDDAEVYQAECEQLESEKQGLVREALEKASKELSQNIPDLDLALENIQSVMLCLEAASESVNQRLAKPHASQETLGLLTQVKAILNSSKEDRIPIEKIGELYIVDGQKPFDGFLKLIFKLGYKEQELKAWKKYLDRESNVLWSPKAAERRQFLTSLFEHLTKQIERLTDHIELEDGNDRAMSRRLNDLSGLLKENYKAKAMIECKIFLHEQERSIRAIDLKESELNIELEALNPCICLLRAMQALRDTIDEFSSRKEKFSADKTLYNDVNRINNVIKKIEINQKSFLDLIQTAAHNQKYSPVYDTLVLLLQSMTEKFNASIFEKFSTVTDSIRALKWNFEGFKAKSPMFSDDSSFYEDAVACQARHAELQQCLMLLSSVIQPGDEPGDYLRLLNDAERSFSPMFDEIADAIELKFDNTLSGLRRCVHECQAKVEAVVQYPAALPEKNLSTDEAVRMIDEQLADCSQYIAYIQAHLANADKILGNIQVLKDDAKRAMVFEIVKNLRAQKEDVQAMYPRLIRVKMMSQLSIKLDQYLAQPVINNPDKSQNFALYISQLKEFMADAAKSGDYRFVMDKLFKGRRVFRADQTQQFLNQLLVTIFDFQRTGMSLDNQPIPNDLSTRALEHLNHIGNFPARKTLKKLYANIDLLQTHARTLLQGADANTVNELSQRLRADVDHFILQHPRNGQISRQEYLTFRDSFYARLHSQDVIIKQYRPLWAVVGSVFLMVLSLGTLPLYNYCVGKSILVCDYTLRMREQIADMGAAVSKHHKFVSPVNS